MHAKADKPIPGRVLLDTNVVNFVLDHGQCIHDGALIPAHLSERVRGDIEALSAIFAAGQRAFWQLAVSPTTYEKVRATTDPNRRWYLENWFSEIWLYWREIVAGAEDIPSAVEADAERIRLMASDVLRVLPDAGDRRLIRDAIAYRCDGFCTRGWSTILKHRESLKALPLEIFAPTEWSEQLRPWSGLWL